jgi:prepilin signal peptidase PulO-like enzyme (type II secretory pathway)
LILLLVFIFLVGAVLGSFLNVVIYRLPINKSVVTPRSSCIKCGYQIKWFENIPILSYIFLRGRCSNCKTNLSLRYPLIEALIGTIAILLFPQNLSDQALIHFFFLFFVAYIFVGLFIIDIEHHLLPDKLNLYLLALIAPYSILNFGYVDPIIGGLIGFGGTYGITYLFYKIKGQIGLGGGDIKLFGILGLYLGPQGIVQLIFLSSLLGSVLGIILISLKKLPKDKPFAFGPYILIVAALQIFFPEFFAKINFYNF